MTEETRRPPSYANPIQAPGTDEGRWLAWDGIGKLPEAELPHRGRVVVVAAHPDDEVLGAGGMVARFAAAGVAVTVVSITDGERSHPESGALTSSDLARRRASELRAALAALGANSADIVRLKVPDTEVAFHEDTVATALSDVLRGAELCLAPWIGDLHGDHEAAGRAALTAAREAEVRCLMYPVWMWHWARPDDPRIPWSSALRVDLTPAEAAAKRSAAQRFVSQIEPLGPEPQDAAILPPEELAHHLRDAEVVFE
ncbi:PIG-L deacetylase family protein [Streptomyces sp. NBC_01198]|uniref:PIG-L deacetylase family protein n=1 Tax=Streptomyces sp. NBC_01198 TaxID=2903769 RepID=UPI002E119B86|nr:PIG-L family deacetylase [Streptomyces sp. NBC_01198]